MEQIVAIIYMFWEGDSIFLKPPNRRGCSCL